MADPPKQRLVKVLMTALDHPQLMLMGEVLRGSKEPTGADLIALQCGVNVSNHPTVAFERYRTISAKDHHLRMFPDERGLFDLALTPLMNAKAAFMTGSYTATIALAGAVAESLADFVFRIYAPDPNDARVPEKRKKDLGSFDRARQSDRITILAALSIVGEEAEKRLRRLNTIRNFYLHPAVRDQSRPEADALEAYENAVWWAADVVGRELVNGSWKLSSPMFQYLLRLGVIKDG